MVVDLSNNCQYLIGNLKPFVLLLPKDTTSIKYIVDSYNSKVERITAQSVIKLETSSTKLTVNEDTNTRLDFSSTVTANLTETYSKPLIELLDTLKFGEYYIVFEDMMGSQYIQSPEFTSEFSYSYTFQSQEATANNCEIKFDVSSNVPVLALDTNLSPTQVIEQCAYNDGTIINLWLTPFDNVLVELTDGQLSTITCTEGEALHTVDFDKSSFNFTQQYDRNGYKEKLTFTIPFKKNVNVWTYNLHQFVQNRYFLMFNTSSENYFAGGFEFGFLPSFTIETTDSADSNFITINLNHSGQNSLLWSESEIAIEESTTDLFAPVTEQIQDPVSGRMLPYYVCQTKTESVYTLIQMLSATGLPTDRYLCLEGYETTYQNLRIIDTYTLTDDFGFPLTFENNECSYKDNCQLEYMPATVYRFKNAGDSVTVPVLGPCPWTIHSLPSWITCNISEGQGGIRYNVTFTCTITGTDRPTNGFGYIQSFDNVGLIQFICQKEPDWYKPWDFTINAAKQTVTVYIYESRDGYTVCDLPEGVTYKKIYGTRKLELYIPENTDDVNAKEYTIKLCSPHHEDGYINILQMPIFYEWREVTGEYICQNGNSYKKLRKYKGYEPDEINIYTGEQRSGSLLVTADQRCKTERITDGEGYMYEFVSGYTTCQGHDLYESSRKRESYDGGISWDWTDEYQLGNLIEEGSSECEDAPTDKQYMFIIDEAQYECLGKTSFYMECQWYSYDGNEWFKTDPAVCQRSATPRRENDVMCGAPQPDPNENYRWVIADGYVCEDGDKWSRLRMQQSTDGGVTWVDTDVYKANYYIEAASEDCQDYPEKEYTWIEWLGYTMCNGVDLYSVERYVYSYDNFETYYVIDNPSPIFRPYQLIEANSMTCGYIPTGRDRLNKNTGMYICVGGSKYDRWDWEHSEDNGETWTKTGESEIGYLVEEDSSFCDNVVSQYEYRQTTNYQCSGCDSYYTERRWESQDGGYTWFASYPTVERISSTIRVQNDPECGCEEPVPTQERWVEVQNDYICE